MLKAINGYSGYSIADVKSAARNNWFHILESLAPGVFTKAIKNGHRRHSMCPFHQTAVKPGDQPDFRFDKKGNEQGSAICSCHSWSNGIDLLMDINRWSLADTVREVGELLNVSPIASNIKLASKRKPPRLGEKPQWLLRVEEELTKRRKREEENQGRIRKKLSQIWDETLPLHDNSAAPAIRYLRRRGIETVPSLDDVRFHKDLPYFDDDGNRVGIFPAMVGRVLSPKGQFVTLHRHYLTPDGLKAGVECQKKMSPVHDDFPATGGAIRIMTPQKGVLGVAEGIETALSAFYGLGIPTWATVSASLLKGFIPPAELNLHTVVIFADKDRSEAGKDAALKLRSKLVDQGYEVLIMAPAMAIPKNAKGVDWNDVLMTQGLSGFPSINCVLKHLPRHSQILMNMRRGAA